MVDNMGEKKSPVGYRLYLFGTPRLEAILARETAVGADGKDAPGTRAEFQTKPLKISRRKSFALLAILAMNRKIRQRQALMTVLWPDTEPGLAYSYLRRELSVLHRALGSQWLTIDRDTVGLTEHGDFWVDVDEFRRNLAACGEHGHAVGEVCPRCMPQLMNAVALYQGDFMAGFSFRDSPNFDEWRFFEAEQLQNDFMGALARLVQGHSAQRNFKQAIDLARLWLEHSPWHEPVHRELMRLYYWSGNEAAAFHQYEICVSLLEQELNQPPDLETVQLLEDLKEKALPLPAMGLFAQEYQTVRQDNQVSASAAPPVTLPATVEDPGRPAAPRSSARVQEIRSSMMPFVGRDEELAMILRLVTNEPACRLLTLVGQGGVGKTRLALEAMSQLSEHFPDGVCLVPLVGVNSPALLIRAVADFLGFPFQREVDPAGQLVDFLRGKSLLLILDSFESLISGNEGKDPTQQTSESLLLDILTDAPGVKILITSLERLHLQVEWVHVVNGLGFPSADPQPESVRKQAALPGRSESVDLSWQEYSAVALFLQLVERVQPQTRFSETEKSAIIDICRQVEGLPLGLELAAAWRRAMTFEEIAAELDRDVAALRTDMRDVPQRHRSMNALFDNCWQLLSADERTAIGKLAIFDGGFTREAARTIAQADMSMLMTLLDKSLLRTGPTGRYYMHEILRHCALERLGEDAEVLAEAHARHAAYFATFVEARRSKLTTRLHRATASEIAKDIENIRAAWRWSVEHARLADIDRSLEGLHRFYISQEWSVEGIEIVRGALERFAVEPLVDAAGTLPVEILRGRLLAREGHLAYHLGRHSDAHESLSAALTLFAELTLQAADDDERRLLAAERAFALRYLGATARKTGNLDQAEACCRQSLGLYEELEEERGLAGTLQHLAIIAAERGDYNEARRLFRTTRALFHKLDDPFGVANTLNNLGVLAELLGELDRAYWRHQECLTMRRSINDRRGIATSLNNLGDLEAKQGNFAEAKKLLLECLEIQEELGGRELLGNCLSNLGATAMGLDELEDARRYYDRALEIAREIDEPALAFEVLVGLARLKMRTTPAQPAEAAILLAYVLRHAEIQESTRSAAEKALEAASNLLDPDAFAHALQKGQEWRFSRILAAANGAPAVPG